MTTDGPLELLHMDLFGPIASIGGSKYCLVIVDDYSRFTWVFFLQKKSQTQETLKGFLRQAQNEFGLRIKKIRSDNGTEFKNFQEDNGANGRLFSNPNGWVTWRRTGQCPVAHRTVRCAHRQQSSPTTIWWLRAINTPQPPPHQASKHSEHCIQ
jgi:transposase InsO family protein